MTMTSARTELDAAERCISRVAAGLNTESEICADCGHRRYADWNAKQASDQLAGTITRIERVRSLLKLDGGYNESPSGNAANFLEG